MQRTLRYNWICITDVCCGWIMVMMQFWVSQLLDHLFGIAYHLYSVTSLLSISQSALTHQPGGDELLLLSCTDLAGQRIPGCCVFFHLQGTAGQWGNHVLWILFSFSTTHTRCNTVWNSYHRVVCWLWIESVGWTLLVCINSPQETCLEHCLCIDVDVYCFLLINFNII